MHDFQVKKNTLCCERTSLAEIARAVGTPAFVYSKHTLLDHFTKLRQAFAEINPLICYSMKANSNLALCRLLVNAGAGLDIVSGGELYRAKKIKADSQKIVYASVGKTAEEIEAAIRAGILFFNVESLSELALINAISGRCGKRQRVALRINPDVSAHTHDYISTAKRENKFGIDIETAREVFIHCNRNLPHVQLCCIHVHIGSQIEQAAPFKAALKKAVALIIELNRRGAGITHLNIGGGLGIIYRKERPQTADEYARAIIPIIKKAKVSLILEPGRFIVGNAGVLLTKILYLKDTPVKRFIIVDAAMNDLLRPSLYGAYHEIIPVEKTAGAMKKADVVGPVCESGDFLAKDRGLPAFLKENDVLAVMGAGAYGFSMSSNYNSRRRAVEVLVDDRRYQIVRKREQYRDLVRNEITGKL
ncbi:MAG: diaminopimelate decarboxylase [Candidatus Omnitrophica bacterium]|nr:diaminopimelate decarboxylase [Candidatus Omnitrophota bacterium]